MRAPLIAVFGVVAMAGIQAASAADMEPPYLKAPPPAPVFSWTGFYIGGNFGAGSASESFGGTQTTPVGATTFGGSAGSDGNSSLLAGGQIGFNWEVPMHLVIGVEADGDWSSIGGSPFACSTFTSGASTGLPAGCATSNFAYKDFGTVRARLGYHLPWGPVMIYGTGGWAFANVSGNTAVTCVGTGCAGTSIPFTGGTASFSNTPSGWAAGGGIEWAFLPSWTLKMEYLRLDFGNVATTYTTTVLAPGPITTTTHLTTNTGVNVFRIGLNYLFHFGGPPLAVGY